MVGVAACEDVITVQQGPRSCTHNGVGFFAEIGDALPATRANVNENREKRFVFRLDSWKPTEDISIAEAES